MVGEWKSITAEQFCTAVRDGTHDSPKPVKHGRFLVTSRHIIGGRLDLGNAYLISQDDFNSINKRSKVDKWDVLISMIGTVGEPCLIKEEPDFAIKNVGLFKSKGEVEGKWLYYYLRSPNNQQIIREQSRGTTQQYIPLGALRKLPIFIPEDKNEMRAIVYILGTLDDKIELNRRMSQTLEEMARAIFKSWFVDFDPVRAKAAVRREHPDWTNAQVSRAACPNLKPEIAELFPDRFVDSELGEIPEGWKIGCIGNEFNITMGQSPPGNTYNEVGEGLPFYQGRTDFGFRFPMRRVYCTAPTRLAKKGDTLISVRAPVGDINIATEDCAIGRGVAAARHKSGSRSYTYQFMHAKADVFARFEAEGTVFGSIGKKDFNIIRCLVPPKIVVTAFDRLIVQLDDRISINENQSYTLAALRDALLPKLISGDIRVKDVERLLKRTT
jgi:type I restriction enzyme S subunit